VIPTYTVTLTITRDASDTTHVERLVRTALLKGGVNAHDLLTLAVTQQKKAK
jgi:hypothetical protein